MDFTNILHHFRERTEIPNSIAEEEACILGIYDQIGILCHNHNSHTYYSVIVLCRLLDSILGLYASTLSLPSWIAEEFPSIRIPSMVWATAWEEEYNFTLSCAIREMTGGSKGGDTWIRNMLYGFPKLALSLSVSRIDFEDSYTSHLLQRPKLDNKQLSLFKGE